MSTSPKILKTKKLKNKNKKQFKYQQVSLKNDNLPKIT